MKSIDTLVFDINKRLVSKEPYPAEAVTELNKSLAAVLHEKLSEVRKAPALRMSNLGKPDRQLWYTINKPELAEPLPAATRMKFLIGDVVEVLTLWLAKMAGHTVTNEQGIVNVAGVRGHIDATVDGELVDAKSASPAGFRKFAKHELALADDFGYRPQLGGYLAGISGLDDTVRKDRAHFLAVEKVLGKIVLDTHSATDIVDGNIEETVSRKRAMLSWPNPPSRCYPEVAEDNGNKKLGVSCGYCPFKVTCWGPTLRAFKYSKGPVFFTKVVKTPSYKGEPLRELSLREATEE